MFYDLCYSYGLVKLFLSNLCVESWAKQTLLSALICCNIWNSPTLRVEKKSPRRPRQKEGACTTALSTHAPRIQSVYPDREMAIKGGRRKKLKLDRELKLNKKDRRSSY